MNSKIENYISSFTGEVLEEGKSDFHHYKFIRNDKYGVCLFLDGILQSSSKDQRIYHTNMTLFALKHAPDVEHVLIIGGAGGGVLHHLMKNRGESIKTVQIVDIDQKLFEIAPRFMYGWNNNEFSDSRVKINYENGVDFLKKTKDKFDIIFLDIGDPLDFTKSNELYDGNVYNNICRALCDKGVLIYHTAPFDINQNIFHQCYEKNIDTVSAEYHSYPIFIESFESTWIFNVIQKKGVKNFNFNQINKKVNQ